MATKRYPSNISEGGWDEIKDLIPAAKKGGRPRTVSVKSVLNECNFLCRQNRLPMAAITVGFPQ